MANRPRIMPPRLELLAKKLEVFAAQRDALPVSTIRSVMTGEGISRKVRAAYLGTEFCKNFYAGQVHPFAPWFAGMAKLLLFL